MAVDDESEYDKEDEEKLECGHTEAEHKKLERVKGKFKDFLADVADDMLTEETLAKLTKVIDKHLKEEKLPNTLQTVKSFVEGFEFGLASFAAVGHKSAEMMAGFNKIVKEREKSINKIDITQSKRLEDHGETKT